MFYGTSKYKIAKGVIFLSTGLFLWGFCPLISLNKDSNKLSNQVEYSSSGDVRSMPAQFIEEYEKKNSSLWKSVFGLIGIVGGVNVASRQKFDYNERLYELGKMEYVRNKELAELRRVSMEIGNSLEYLKNEDLENINRIEFYYNPRTNRTKRNLGERLN